MRAAGEATRERILAAAKAEFAEFGVAGARINRIATAARASKDRLYAYFPGKDELYAAVTERWTAQTTAETALAADDLPGYVGRLFDHFVANPDNARLQAWADLEPTTHAAVATVLKAAIAPKLAEIRRGQAAGTVTTEFHPAALLRILTDLARTSATHAIQATSGPSRAAQREAIVLAARRLVEPRP
ncbi:TetR family transcriptional regulator [Nocardia farcinica]|uniref:Rut operon repressor n=1 Tax=Nocardia farcinica TaxID=37329 RepID=A0A0H5NKS2_NOCFR|nr:TetR family transcriptional regulator [Nocardia farcinica]AXK84907.1 TetR/AcrR family transcriptional regulator [Nocardia farcinica]MBF6249653.1 TetR family transcriptional regulator [Nocardia farcinica]MBF6260972.1 TetR family transcriptional regulator [Nocardia farcinica]MBF6279360.1 TetR family transcriptional regulator [Nocardia farcinica]MBF6290529.1 TetR family transcriptional regulator [Nocardia farcinica]